MRVQLHIHRKGYKHKPSGMAVASISNEITNEAVTVTPTELADLVGFKGHTTVLATMNGSRKLTNMTQQQVLMVDFDNTETVTKNGKKKKIKTDGLFYTSIDEVLDDSFIKENASFIYKTLSHTETWHKFRVVFILDKPLNSLEEVYSAYEYLFEKYSNADTSCKDPSRLFFGGTEVIEIDYDNILVTDSLPKPEIIHTPVLKVVAEPKVEQAKRAKPVKEKGETPTWKLIQQGNQEEVSKRLSVYACNLPSKVMAVNYLKSLNMIEFLGVEFNPFFDFFHYEKSPSSGIFKMEKADVWLYKCHSSSQDNTAMDIIMVTKKLLGSTYMEALKYLLEVTGIQIVVTEQIKEIREQCDLFLNLLMAEDLKETYPAIHSRFWRYKTDIVAILTIFKENLYEDEEGNLRSLTWLSINSLSVKLYGTDSKKGTIRNVLNLLTYTNWIDKLDESQIPKPLFTKLKETQNRNKREKRSNVFELLHLGDDFFTQLNKQCEEMKEKGFTMKGFSKEYVERTDGVEKANEVYVQDKNRRISPVSKKITSDIHKVALKMMEKNGYVVEKELLAKVQKKWKSKGFTERKYKQAVSEMLDMYGLQRKRLTKQLREDLGINNLPPKAMPTILTQAI